MKALVAVSGRVGVAGESFHLASRIQNQLHFPLFHASSCAYLTLRRSPYLGLR